MADRQGSNSQSAQPGRPASGSYQLDLFNDDLAQTTAVDLSGPSEGGLFGMYEDDWFPMADSLPFEDEPLPQHAPFLWQAATQPSVASWPYQIPPNSDASQLLPMSGTDSGSSFCPPSIQPSSAQADSSSIYGKEDQPFDQRHLFEGVTENPVFDAGGNVTNDIQIDRDAYRDAVQRAFTYGLMLGRKDAQRRVVASGVNDPLAAGTGTSTGELISAAGTRKGWQPSSTRGDSHFKVQYPAGPAITISKMSAGQETETSLTAFPPRQSLQVGDQHLSVAGANFALSEPRALSPSRVARPGKGKGSRTLSSRYSPYNTPSDP